MDPYAYLLWCIGTLLLVAALPFLPRNEVRTPLRAIAFAVLFGAFLPIFVLFALVKYVPHWYFLRWIEYREFLTAAKAQDLREDFDNKWIEPNIERAPDLYEREKIALDDKLKQLKKHSEMLYSRKISLERKIGNR